MILNEFRGILQEILALELILLPNEIVYLEAFVEISKKNLEFYDPIQSFRAWEAKNYTVYLRIYIFHDKLYTFNEKTTIFELLKLFLKKKYPENCENCENCKNCKNCENCENCEKSTKNFENFLFFSEKFEYKQGIFKKLRKFIFSEILEIFEENGLNQVKSCKIMRILSQKIEKNRKKAKNFLQIYRSILSIKPLQILTIFFDFAEEIFVFQVYNNEKSKMIVNRLRVREAEKLLPYLRAFLKAGLYQKLGIRIVKELKLKLLMNAYLKIK